MTLSTSHTAAGGLGDAPSEGPRYTVLIVDDDFDVREMLADLLDELGFDSVAAADGYAALDLLESHSASIDVMLCDHRMPGMLGAQLAARAHQAWPQLPIVLFTALRDDTLSPSLPGVHAVLDKSVSAALLRKTPAAAIRASFG